MDVKSSDFEVFEALAMDSVSAGQKTGTCGAGGALSPGLCQRIAALYEF